jgi:hypothetical protein
MTRRGVIGLFAGVAVGCGLAGCGLLTSSASYRYRMRVEGSYSGASVYEILAEKVNGPRMAEERPGSSIIRGEALALETPSGPVFVLLQPAEGGADLIGAITRALAPDIPWDGQPSFWKAVNRLGGWFADAKADLPRAVWPMMVRFGDINDPKTVERVDPTAIGVTRIALETTGDAVTTGIEKRLGWLATHNGALAYDGSMHPNAPEKDLNQRAFWSGAK